MISVRRCPLCGEAHSASILRDRLPLYRVLESTAELDDSLFAELDIARCPRCFHLFNAAADDDLLSRLYRDSAMTNVPVNPSMFARFSEIATWLDSGIFERKNVIEIGAGGGYLARILAQKADMVTVFEPNRRLDPHTLAEKNIRLVPSVFPAPREHWPEAGLADLVVCRHVVEHVLDPVAFLQSIAHAMRSGGWAYIEVPDLHYTINNSVLSNFYLQHVHYFTMSSLRAVALRAGLVAQKEIRLMDGHDFGILFFKPETPAPKASLESDPLPSAKALWRLFADSRRRARESVAALAEPLALYGANLHAQTFLCAVSDIRPFSVVLDDNPANAGKMFLDRSTLIPIVAPSAELLASMKTVVIGAFLHDKAIRNRLKELGFSGDVVSIHSCSSSH